MINEEKKNEHRDTSNAVQAPLLELRHASKHFGQSSRAWTRFANPFSRATPERLVQAVDDVSLSIVPGEVFGLAGESGCGKSTLGRLVAGIHPLSSGTRLWKGEDLDQFGVTQRRSKQLGIQMVFQDPYASLNPRMRVRNIIGEAPVAHGMISANQQKTWVETLMGQVGLDPSMAERFPHQFSGGQRARIGIARALAVNPELLVCDEAVAALDVSIQAQVLNLFMELRSRLSLAYLFISHDLGVMRYLSDRVAIMYLGRFVELAPTQTLFSRPNHPYTVALLTATPTLEGEKRIEQLAEGEAQPPLGMLSGCRFHPRCPHAMQRCRMETPALQEIAPGHFSACHLNDGLVSGKKID